MPYCTREANSRLVHDVNEDVMQIWGREPWNEEYSREAKPLQLTFGDTLPDSTKASTKQIRKHLVRGVRDPDKGYFKTTPVFRIPLEDLSLFNQLRFMERITNVQKYGPHNIVYEPDLADIRLETVGDTAGLQYPIWIMDYLIAHGFLEAAEKFVKLPGVPDVESDDYASTPELNKLIRETYAARKEHKENTYEHYSKTKEFEMLADRFSVFNLKECEDKNLKANSKKTKVENTEEEPELASSGAGKKKFT